jgi:hypothetical protein
MNTQPAVSTFRRLAGFAVGIVLLTGCQAGWGATSEKSTPERPGVTVTAPADREAAAPDPG